MYAEILSVSDFYIIILKDGLLLVLCKVPTIECGSTGRRILTHRDNDSEDDDDREGDGEGLHGAGQRPRQRSDFPTVCRPRVAFASHPTC